MGQGASAASPCTEAGDNVIRDYQPEDGLSVDISEKIFSKQFTPFGIVGLRCIFWSFVIAEIEYFFIESDFSHVASSMFRPIDPFIFALCASVGLILARSNYSQIHSSIIEPVAIYMIGLHAFRRSADVGVHKVNAAILRPTCIPSRAKHSCAPTMLRNVFRVLVVDNGDFPVREVDLVSHGRMISGMHND